MPQECMRESTSRTALGLSTCSPVVGQMPPLASVAAITDTLSAVTSMEQHWGREGFSVHTAKGLVSTSMHHHH